VRWRKAIQDEPILGSLAYVIPRMGLSLSDARELAKDPIMLSFYYYAARDQESSDREWLETSLGIRVTAESIESWIAEGKPKKKGGKLPSVYWLPFLAQMKDIKYYKEVAKMVSSKDGKSLEGPPEVAMGSYKPQKGEKIISLSEAPKGAWMEHLKKTGVYDPKVFKEVEEHVKKSEEKRAFEEGDGVDWDQAAEDKNLTDATKEEHIEKLQQAGIVAPTKQDEKDIE